MKGERIFPSARPYRGFCFVLVNGATLYGRGEYDSRLITFCIKHVFRYDLIFCSLQILSLRLNKIIRGANALYFFLHYKNKIARVVSQLRFTPVKRMREVLARYLTEIMS